MEEAKILSVVPGKTDKEQAEEYKRQLVAAYEPVLRLLDEMHGAGFEAMTQCGMGPLGRYVIQQMTIFKKFS